MSIDLGDSDNGDLLARAKAGDGDAFQRLISPHRYELLAHCYRILGSLQDAEDTLQETLLAAWQALRGFEGRASLRNWLYTIATNRSLNALRAIRRRPAAEWDIPGVVPPTPTSSNEIVWLEPFPDDIAHRVGEISIGPEASYEHKEAISLAFVTALQLLPPRQVAVLILRDVLGYRASEVAEMLETSTESVTSALKRARASVRQHQEASSQNPPAPEPGSAAEEALVSEFVGAYESSDVDGLIALLTDDVFMSMPPMPFQYEGKTAITEFWRRLLLPSRKYRLVPTRANGQPATGAYVQGHDGLFHATSLFVLTLAGDKISALTRFEHTVLPWFGLSQTLPDRPTDALPGRS